MNLLMFNLAVDDEHVTLAFGLRWIEELAKRFDHIDVVTMYEGKHQLPPNVKVWSVGRERGYPKWFRVLRFYWLLARVWRERRPAVAFAHMIPLFSVFFAPVAWLTGCPSILWYAHGATPRALRLAHRLVDRVVTSTQQGFRIRSDKLSVIGQGIDLDLFSYKRRTPGSIFRIVTVGRLAPSKGQDVLISALKEWCPADGRPWKLTIVGDATSDGEREFADKVRGQALAVSAFNHVEFTGRLPPSNIIEHLREADVFVSLGTTGSLDKAIVEAMASGCLVLSCNDSFAELAAAGGFANCVIGNDERAIRIGLTDYLKLDQHQRDQIAERQAHVAKSDHGLNGLIDKLSDIFYGAAEGRAP